jgi:hypothetical protein
VVQIKTLPKKYQKLIEELKEADFDLGDVLAGSYDQSDLFTSCPTFVELAVEKIVDKLSDAPKNPRDFIDSDGDFGYTINVQEFVNIIIEDLNTYFSHEE